MQTQFISEILLARVWHSSEEIPTIQSPITMCITQFGRERADLTVSMTFRLPVITDRDMCVLAQLVRQPRLINTGSYGMLLMHLLSIVSNEGFYATPDSITSTTWGSSLRRRVGNRWEVSLKKVSVLVLWTRKKKNNMDKMVSCINSPPPLLRITE